MSSLYDIINVLKNTFGFKYVFIVLSACRGGELDSEHAKNVLSQRERRDDESKTNAEVLDANVAFFRKDNKKRFRENTRGNPILKKLGGSMRKKMRAKRATRRRRRTRKTRRRF